MKLDSVKEDRGNTKTLIYEQIQELLVYFSFLYLIVSIDFRKRSVSAATFKYAKFASRTA